MIFANQMELKLHQIMCSNKKCFFHKNHVSNLTVVQNWHQCKKTGELLKVFEGLSFDEKIKI